jgi:multiple sugar transport system ATP-binding protein
MAEVVLENLNKIYPNGVRALCDFSLQVADGELIVLVGPSGCGKTTTLRLIAGLEAPTSGTIRIGGRPCHSRPARERNVAMVFQRPALYPHLSVRRNLEFGLRMRHNGWLKRWLTRWFQSGRATDHREQHQEVALRTTAAARLIGLEDVLERLPNQLSGGQQQRVALGRALVRQPAVFLLDEPLSQLDGRLRSELRRELHLLQRRLRATMIYVTHDQAEAMTLADRVVVLDRGVVQQVDRPLAVYERPANRFVAAFLGWPAMNFAEGHLALDEGGLWFKPENAGWRLSVAEGSGSRWAGLLGRPLTLGLRPEAIQLAEPGHGGAGLTMEVALVEPLGPVSLVTLQRDGWYVTARLPGRLALEPHQTVEVAFSMANAHWFDRATGLALYPGRPAG